MKWNKIETVEQLKSIIDNPEKASLIFKHSSWCATSGMTLGRLERSWKESDMEGINVYFLDVIRQRDISDAIAKGLNVPHQSPQVLLVKGRECIYHNSHFGIVYDDIKSSWKNIQKVN